MATRDQRRRQLAREKLERRQRRQEQQRRRARRRNAVIAAALAVVLAAGAAAAATGVLGGDGERTAREAADPVPSPSGGAADPCDEPAKGSPGTRQWKKEPKLTVDRSATYTMRLETTCGDIEIAMAAGKAPRTVNSFRFLAGQGYFDHTKCHRLTTKGIHVLQCGDPKGTGEGGPGYTIPDENLKDPRLEGGVYPAGTVAMANRYTPADPKTRDSGGSQFFLVHKDSKLPPDYTPFGTVEKGMDVLRKIAGAGAEPPGPTGNTAPRATVVIDKATVTAS